MSIRSSIKSRLSKTDKSPTFSPGKITFCTTLYILFSFNFPVLTTVYKAHGVHSLWDYGFMLSAIILIGILIYFTVMLLAFRPFFKAGLILLLFGSALTAYFMRSYHVMIDNSMMANIIETDYREARALFSWQLVFSVVLFAGFPSAILLMIPVKHENLLRSTLKNTLTFTASCICIVIIAGFYYQDYASLLRNNRHLRDQIVPLNYVYAGYTYGRDQLKSQTKTLQTLGTDAHRINDWTTPPSGKKVVTLLIVGETARAKNFSLGGYTRKTNPELENQNIIYLDNFSSCGTTTSVSVPCMFSHLAENDFSTADAKNTENLLDVISHAGLNVLWRDNNSGCKGVCERVDYDDVSHLQVDDFCNEDECYDEILLDRLQEKISAYPENNALLIVLHMHGSHGPDYFLRVPESYHKYTPFCHTNQLQDCSQQEIINAYDSTILYTDHVLSETINFLKHHQDQYSSSLFFLSDHGESLGENNLYLHGIPRSIAPEEQTHIPALLWISESFSKDFGIDVNCMRRLSSRSLSQDNVFHSLLGMLKLSTNIYEPELDMFRECQQ